MVGVVVVSALLLLLLLHMRVSELERTSMGAAEVRLAQERAKLQLQAGFLEKLTEMRDWMAGELKATGSSPVSEDRQTFRTEWHSELAQVKESARVDREETVRKLAELQRMLAEVTASAPPKTMNAATKPTTTQTEGGSSSSLFSLQPLQPSELAYAEEKRVANEKLAILVAFRDGCGKGNQGDGREGNLREFRAHMARHLATHNPSLDYVIIVAEQTKRGVFNKGALFNSAFLAAVRLFKATYVVFHDVDQLPESERNTYALGETPLHMCAASSQFGYQMAYGTMVGGALMMRSPEVVLFNGFSNVFDGWGLEDDDMYRRIETKRGTVHRLDGQAGRYRALSHPRVMGLDEGEDFKVKYSTMMKGDFSSGVANVHVRASLAGKVEASERYLRFLVEVRERDGVTQAAPC